jgi:hypothetical protein
MIQIVIAAEAVAPKAKNRRDPLQNKGKYPLTRA